MDHLLEEKKANQEQNTSKENWYLQNKGMEELRKEHALQPTTKGGANRLRLMCSHYTNNEDDKGETSDWVKQINARVLSSKWSSSAVTGDLSQ